MILMIDRLDGVDGTDGNEVIGEFDDKEHCESRWRVVARRREGRKPVVSRKVFDNQSCLECEKKKRKLN